MTYFLVLLAGILFPVSTTPTEVLKTHALVMTPVPVVEDIAPAVKEITWQEKLNANPKLKALAKCESGLNPNAINPHDGGTPSYGLLQWKTESFWRYNQKYKVFPHIEKHEIANVIMWPETQIELTEKVLAEPEGWRNWTNCWLKISRL